MVIGINPLSILFISLITLISCEAKTTIIKNSDFESSKNQNIYEDVAYEMMYFPYRSISQNRSIYNSKSFDVLRDSFPEEFSNFQRLKQKKFQYNFHISFSDTVWSTLDSQIILCLNDIKKKEPDFKIVIEDFIEDSKTAKDSLITSNDLNRLYEKDFAHNPTQVILKLSYITISKNKGVYVSYPTKKNNNDDNERINYHKIILIKYDNLEEKWYVYNAYECLDGKTGAFR